MKYSTEDAAYKALRFYGPAQIQESLFKKGDVVTVKTDEFELVDTDKDGKNNDISAKIVIQRGDEKIERYVTLRTLFGKIRTDIPEDIEENVDTILPLARAKYESRFIAPFNVADAIKLRHLPQEWKFTIEERLALVYQLVDRKADDVAKALTWTTLNGQYYINGLYRLKKVTCSKR